jgi:hypothetical protein
MLKTAAQVDGPNAPTDPIEQVTLHELTPVKLRANVAN